MTKEFKKFILDILQDIFYISLVTFILFSLMEIIRPRFLTAHINMNALLMIIIITGIITVTRNEN